MKGFLDTNVLASAFGTRGLCADVLRVILAEHELVTGEVVIEGLRAVLKGKFGVPIATIGEIDGFLRGYHVEPRPRELPDLKLTDRNDLLMVGSALGAKAELLITGIGKYSTSRRGRRACASSVRVSSGTWPRSAENEGVKADGRTLPFPFFR